MKSILTLIVSFALLMSYQACSQNLSSSLTDLASKGLGNADETEGGHEHGNGGDDLRYAKTAWFAKADQSVRYCVQMSADFPVARDRVQELISASLQDWQQLMTEMSMHSVSLVAKTFSLQSGCGSVDLKIQFGDAAPEGVNSSVAAAIRESYETSRNWSQGMIWVSASGANWSESFRLKAALLHLFGEVFGFSNVAGTIMDERWQEWVQAAHTAELEEKLSKIEGERRLMGSLGTLRGFVAMNDKLKTALGLSSSAEKEMIEVSLGQLRLTVQNKSLRFVILYQQKLRRGDLHRVVSFNTAAPYEFMRTIPQFFTEADNSKVAVIQMIDLPGKPQIAVELNGDVALGMAGL